MAAFARTVSRPVSGYEPGRPVRRVHVRNLGYLYSSRSERPKKALSGTRPESLHRRLRLPPHVGL